MNILIKVANPEIRTIIEDAIDKLNLWSEIVYHHEDDVVYDLVFQDKSDTIDVNCNKWIRFSEETYSTNMNHEFSIIGRFFKVDKFNFFLNLLEYAFRIKKRHSVDQKDLFI